MIAFICHPYHRGGVTRWMADMAIAYGRMGVDVFFVTVIPNKEFISAGGKEKIVDLLEEADGIKVISENVGWEFELGTETYRAGIYSKLLRQNVPLGVPVILSNDPSAWMVATLSKGRNNFVGVLHADEMPYYELAKKHEADINVWICVSNRVKKNLLQLSNDFSRKDIHVIPCGIFLPNYEYIVRNNTGNVKLVYVGRIDEYQKRVSDLVKIGLELKNKKIEFQLKIIGDGPDKNPLEKKFHDAGLQENIHFLGWLSKESIMKILFGTDLLLLTSNFEGMPVAVMEALSAGCGIVSTRVSGVEDLEQDILAPKCLWLNDVGDTDCAVSNIIYAMNNVIPLTRSTAARQLAEKEFSMEMCVKRYESLLEYKQISTPNKVANPVLSNGYSYLISFLRFIKLGILSAIRK